MNKNIWVVRPKPHGINRVKEFMKEDVIAIGFPEIPDLSSLNKEEIQEIVEQKDSIAKDSRKAALHAGILFRFAHQIEPGDLVVVPDDENVHIAEVDGSYKYVEEKKDENYPHQRRVEWLKKDLARHEMPDELQGSLRSQLTLYSLDKYSDQVFEWLNKEIPEGNNGLRYPARSNSNSNQQLKDAVFLKSLLRYGLLGASSLVHDLFDTLAKECFPSDILEQAETIVEQLKIWCKEPEAEENQRGERLLYEDEFVEEILDMIEDGSLEAKLKEEREKLYQEAKRTLKETLEEAKQGNRSSLRDALVDIDKKERLVNGIYEEVVEEVLNEVGSEAHEILKTEKRLALLLRVDFTEEEIDKLIEERLQRKENQRRNE